MHSSGNSYLDEDEEDEFAEFVFAATCDIDCETNIHIEYTSIFKSNIIYCQETFLA